MDHELHLRMEEQRSRTKERLEISLAWLCELDILKQRQEGLVLGALALGDTVPGCPAWGDVGPARSSREQEQLTLRRHLNRLQDAPSLLMLALQQQLSELRVDTGLTCEPNAEEELDSPSASSSGFYEQSECLSPPLRTCSTPNLAVSCHGLRSVDAYMLDWEGHMEPTIHATLPRSFSAPYPPLEGIAEGIEEEEEDEESTRWVTDQMVEVGSIADEDESFTPDMSLTADAEGNPTVKTDDVPTAEDIQQAMRVEAYILNLLQRRHFRMPPELNSDLTQWEHPYQPSYPDQPEWHEWAALSEEENQDESQEGYYINNPNAQAGPDSLESEEPESSLETDQYGVADISSSNDEIDSPQHQRGYFDHHPTILDAMKPHVHACCNQTCSAMSSTLESREQHQLLPSQDWIRFCSLARSSSEEKWTSRGKHLTNTTSRSRSEDGSSSQGWATAAEHKYYTVGRDTGKQHNDNFYTSGERLWCSSAELGQDQNEGVFKDEVHEMRRKHLPAHALKHSCVQFVEQNQRVGKGLERAVEPTDGSDSSLSGTFSPATSSVSSDSDESGGLVWPQQLPPRLLPSSSTSSSQNPSSSVVKIKASHALKKKILRFRSGSLKLMTTV